MRYYLPKVRVSRIVEEDVAPISRDTKLLLEESKKVLAVLLVLLRVDVTQTNLSHACVLVRRCTPGDCSTGLTRTMVRRNAGSNVPAKVRLGLCLTLIEM